MCIETELRNGTGRAIGVFASMSRFSLSTEANMLRPSIDPHSEFGSHTDRLGHIEESTEELLRRVGGTNPGDGVTISV